MDFLREGIRLLAQAMMEADVTAQIGAALGEHAPDERTTRRSGYRPRRWDTRAGTVDVAIPKLRQGSYFPDFLLEPRRRAELKRQPSDVFYRRLLADEQHRQRSGMDTPERA